MRPDEPEGDWEELEAKERLMARIYLTNDPASILRRRPDLNAYQPEVTATGVTSMPVTIPLWSDPNTPEGSAFFAAAKKFKALYTAAGYSNPFAFGMLTMAEAESSFEVNALGDFVDERGKRLPWSAHPVGTPTSFGAHQRKMDRVIEIRDGRKDGKVTGLGFDIADLARRGQNSIENEVRSVLWELNAYPSYGLAQINGAKTAYGVAYNATVSFERAGTVSNGAAEKRGVMAETWVALASGIWPKTRGPAPAGWVELSAGW